MKKAKKKHIHNDPDDLIRAFKTTGDEQPEIYSISKRGRSLSRKRFIEASASIAGLYALGSLLKSCVESELDIVKKDNNCACHAVCTCNSEHKGDFKFEKGNVFESQYDVNQVCTCNTVCTCNSVCTCDSVCGSDTGGGGGGGTYYTYYYTYWYPN
jgi:hypothetical protein